jgi:hypothetical protein
VDASTFYADNDGDGLGDESTTIDDCLLPAGYVTAAGDCDDTDVLVGPETEWFADNDADGYGNASVSEFACPGDESIGFIADDTDCNDVVFQANPGEAEVEDGVDNDCDLLVDWADDDLDSDGDGLADATGGNLFGSCASSGEDEYATSCTTGAVEYATGTAEDQSGNGPTSDCNPYTTYGLDAVEGECVLVVAVDATTGDWNTEEWTWSFETAVTAGADVRCSVELGADRYNATFHYFITNAATGVKIYPTSSSYNNLTVTAPMWTRYQWEFNTGAATTINVRFALGDTSSSAMTVLIDGFSCMQLL